MGLEKRKEVLKMMAYGIYVVTSKSRQGISASTITWVSQASMEPPLISICLKKDTFSYNIIKSRKEFVLHMVAIDQKDIASKFFKIEKIDRDRINGKKYFLEADLPVFVDLPAYVKCEVVEIVEKGDHSLFLAEVNKVKLNKNVLSLDLRSTGWSYGG